MKEFSVSVVIPVFNGESFIEGAIKTVKAQTFPVEEIIVVDNNCHDKTAEIAQSMGAKIVTEPRQGLAMARSRGISVAASEWIAFLDVDDLWEPRKLELQMNAAKKFPQSQVITRGYQIMVMATEEILEIISLNAKLKPFADLIISDDETGFCPKVTAPLFDTFLLQPSTAVINRRVLENAGTPDPRMMIEDIEYFARVLKDNPLTFVKRELVKYRFHNSNLSKNIDAFKEITTMVEKMLRFPDNYIEGIGERIKMYLKNQLIQSMKRDAKKHATE